MKTAIISFGGLNPRDSRGGLKYDIKDSTVNQLRHGMNSEAMRFFKKDKITIFMKNEL